MALIDLPTDRLLTVGTLAQLTGHTRDRVAFVVQSRGIKATARAGRVRVFDAATAERILRELEAIEARQSGMLPVLEM